MEPTEFKQEVPISKSNQIEGSNNVLEIETMERERKAWREVLGVDVEVEPFPRTITLKAIESLEHFGMELRWMPHLDLGTKEDLEDRGEEDGVERYLKDLEWKYPNWHRLEGLSTEELGDYRIPRNVERYYWERVKKGIAPFPKLDGYWMGVEVLSKPNVPFPQHQSSGEYDYEHTKMTDYISEFGGCREDRLYCSWQSIDNVLSYRQNYRLLEVLEWNLLANREGWGHTNFSEWTNTPASKHRYSFPSLYEKYFTIGSKGHAGSPNAGFVCPVQFWGSSFWLSFRLAKEFK